MRVALLALFGNRRFSCTALASQIDPVKRPTTLVLRTQGNLAQPMTLAMTWSLS